MVIIHSQLILTYSYEITAVQNYAKTLQ